MPGPIDYTRITVAPDQDMQQWWEATKQEKFMLAQCKDCGHKWWPPFPGCKKCTSTNLGWYEIKGEGEIHSYIVVVQPIMGHTIKTVPYVVAIIELPDGTNTDGSKTRIVTMMLDDEKDVAIGLPVKLEWEDHPKQEYKIPRWRISAKTAPNVWRYPG